MDPTNLESNNVSSKPTERPEGKKSFIQRLNDKLEESNKKLDAREEAIDEKLRLQREKLQQGSITDELKALGKSIKDTGADIKKTTQTASRMMESFSQEDLTLYREILQSRGVLVDSNEFLSAYLPNLQEAFLQVYGNEIGRKKILEFFSSFSQDSILVVRGDQFDRVVDAWSGNQFDESERMKRYREQGYQVLGSHHSRSDITFLKGPDELRFSDDSSEIEHALGEELAHKFLNYSQKTQIPLLSNVPIIRNLAHMFKKNNGETVEIEDYMSDQEEQIVKAMNVRLIQKLHPQTSVDSEYQQIATVGERRIHEIGWKQILKGHFTTNHEQDFRVVPQNGNISM